MNNNILVSVVIPCTDRTEGLLRCINSALEQIIEDSIEIIIVENNSHNKNVVSSLVFNLDDERIKHVYMDICDNANCARNYGISLSSGQYIAYLDSDDWWDKAHLESCLNCIKESNVKAIYSGCKLHDGLSVQEKKSRQIEDESAYSFLFGTNRGVAQTSSFFLDKSVFFSASWDESLKRSQDYDFFVSVNNAHGWHYKEDITVNVYWEVGAIRSPSVSSFKGFYEKHSVEMTDDENARYLAEALKSLVLYSKNDFKELHQVFKRYRSKIKLIDRVYLFNYISAYYASHIKTCINKLKSLYKQG
ncbi:glycosyltransferase family 2 protein [Neptuniibacter sp. SY11_33]|uniref:glycosyltransferase family 2 protein n=1 Tax=Neptuniibacter sp. SY11_33 TaxID=3398215 RepID=UPI0039F45041